MSIFISISIQCRFQFQIYICIFNYICISFYTLEIKTNMSKHVKFPITQITTAYLIKLIGGKTLHVNWSLYNDYEVSYNHNDLVSMTTIDMCVDFCQNFKSQFLFFSKSVSISIQ